MTATREDLLIISVGPYMFPGIGITSIVVGETVRSRPQNFTLMTAQPTGRQKDSTSWSREPWGGILGAFIVHGHLHCCAPRIIPTGTPKYRGRPLLRYALLLDGRR